MAEENDTTQGHEENDDDGSDLVRNLRQQLKDRDEELKAHRPLVRERALREAGFDPATSTGRMLSDLADQQGAALTKEGMAELAAKYNLEPEGDSGGGDDGGEGSAQKPGRIDGDDSQHQADQARAAGTERVDGVVEEAGRSADQHTDREAVLARIDQAEEEGDVLTVIHLQRQLTDVPK